MVAGISERYGSIMGCSNERVNSQVSFDKIRSWEAFNVAKVFAIQVSFDYMEFLENMNDIFESM